MLRQERGLARRRGHLRWRDQLEQKQGSRKEGVCLQLWSLHGALGSHGEAVGGDWGKQVGPDDNFGWRLRKTCGGSQHD